MAKQGGEGKPKHGVISLFTREEKGKQSRLLYNILFEFLDELCRAKV
jgi:hypothetical protein